MVDIIVEYVVMIGFYSTNRGSRRINNAQNSAEKSNKRQKMTVNNDMNVETDINEINGR